MGKETKTGVSALFNKLSLCSLIYVFWSLWEQSAPINPIPPFFSLHPSLQHSNYAKLSQEYLLPGLFFRRI